MNIIMLDNPFVLYGYEGPENFCDREQESQSIKDGLYNGSHICVISPRRMGKTGLVHHVLQQIRNERKDARCFYVDIYSTKDLSDFVRQIAKSIIGKLDTPLQKAESFATQFFKGTQLTVSTDVFTGLPKWGISFQPHETEYTLDQLFDYIAQSGRECYVAIDEFQQINEYPEKNVEALLRTHVQNARNVHFIFLGSKLHMMSAMFNSPKHPFFKSTEQLALSALNEDVYFTFAQERLLRKNVVLPKEIFEKLYAQVDGVTWYIQAVLNMLYRLENIQVDEQILLNSICQVIMLQEAGYRQQYDVLTQTQAKLLLAVAQEGRVKAIRASSFIQRYHLKSGSIDRALDYLLNNEYIYRAENEYVVYDRFFGLWLKEQ